MQAIPRPAPRAEPATTATFPSSVFMSTASASIHDIMCHICEPTAYYRSFCNFSCTGDSPAAISRSVWRSPSAPSTATWAPPDPPGLVAKGSIWYLVAEIDASIRSYRVSRVQEATILDASFVRPVGFDLEKFWEESSMKFKERLPRYEVVIRATAPTVTWLRTL